MKATAVCVTVLVVSIFISSCCKRDPEPGSNELTGYIGCLNQNYLCTQRGILTFHNFNLGDIVAFNRDDKSLTLIGTIEEIIVERWQKSLSISDSEKVEFERVSNIEVDDMKTMGSKKLEG